MPCVLLIHSQMMEAAKKKIAQTGTPENTRLIKLSKSAEGISEILEEEEININGSLYDIAYLQDKGDSVYCYCLSDIEEESLMAELGNTYSQYQSSPVGHSHQSVFLKDILKEFTVYKTMNIHYPHQFCSAYHFPTADITTTSGYCTIDTPPPRFI